MSANTPAAVMDLLQGRLGSLVGRSSGYIETLPKEVLQRVRGLKGVQSKHADLETKFHEEVLELEKKYADLYKPLYERRAEIVSGKAEPTEEEVEAGKKVEAQEAEEEGITVEEKAEEEKESGRISIEKGIPEFWLTALKNHPQIADLITERDEEALKALTDISMSYLEANPGFCLSFHFAENNTFTNSVLTKTYYYQSEAVAGDLVYDRAEGTKIDWKPDQDLSVTVQTKRQRHKGTNQTRLVKKTVPADTFFSFFSPPVNPSAPAEDDDDESAQEEDLDERLEADYELGEEFKEKVVPHAIDWFTGKALGYEDMDEDDYYHGEDHDEDDDEEDDDEDDEDDNDDDDDENDDKAPAKDEKAPECKQQ